MNTSINYTYDIPAMDFSKAGEASTAIKIILKQLGIESKVIRNVAIATYEAEINIAIHSEGGTITCDISPDDILITAIDNGPGIKDIDKAMEMGYSTASKKARELGFGAGMGLPNMKRCSDDFSITSAPGDSTTIKMTFLL